MLVLVGFQSLRAINSQIGFNSPLNCDVQLSFSFTYIYKIIMWLRILFWVLKVSNIPCCMMSLDVKKKPATKVLVLFMPYCLPLMRCSEFLFGKCCKSEIVKSCPDLIVRNLCYSEVNLCIYIYIFRYVFLHRI